MRCSTVLTYAPVSRVQRKRNEHLGSTPNLTTALFLMPRLENIFHAVGHYLLSTVNMIENIHCRPNIVCIIIPMIK